MPQRFLLFVILLSPLFIKSEMLANAYIKVKLVFYYSSGENRHTMVINVTTCAVPAINSINSYLLMGNEINDHTLSVTTVRCVKLPSLNSNCENPSKTMDLSLENLMEIERYVLRIDYPTSRIISLLHNLSLLKSKEKHKFNLTCVILEASATFTDKPRHPYSDPFSKTSLFTTIFLGVCAVLTCGLCTIWFSIIYYRRFRQQRKDSKLRQVLEKSTQQMLDKSPIIIFDSENRDNEHTDESPMCAICLESFKNKEKIRKLVCSHSYHIACIDPWLLSHQSCPLCNRNILRNSIPTISSTIIQSVNEQNYHETTFNGDHGNNPAQNSNL